MNNDSTPFLSIVTITFNDVAGFRRTAKSVIPQLNPDVEWIVKDGGSESSIVAEIRRIAAGSNAIVISSRDNGVYYAMNQAKRVALGQWILFMNGGDEFASLDVVERIRYSVLSQCSSLPSRAILLGSTYVVADNGMKHLSQTRSISDCSGINSYRMPAFHQSQVYSRSVYASLDFRERLSISADHVFFWEAYQSASSLFDLGFPVSVFYLGGISSTRVFESLFDVGYSFVKIQRIGAFVALVAIAKKFFATLFWPIYYGR